MWDKYIKTASLKAWTDGGARQVLPRITEREQLVLQSDPFDLEKDGSILILWLYHSSSKGIHDIMYTPGPLHSMLFLRITPVVLDPYPTDDEHIMVNATTRIEKSEEIIKDL